MIITTEIGVICFKQYKSFFFGQLHGCLVGRTAADHCLFQFFFQLLFLQNQRRTIVWNDHFVVGIFIIILPAPYSYLFILYAYSFLIPTEFCLANTIDGAYHLL